MNAPPGIVPWKGPEGWKGEALSDHRGYDFAGVPWMRVRREGRIIGDFECVKSSNSRRVLRHVPEAGPAVYVKRYLVNNWRRRIGVRLLGTRAGREFHLGHRLIEAGIATPVPLAWAAHSGTFRIRYRNKYVAIPPASYLLTREWRNQGSVREWLEANPQGNRRLIEGLARFLADAHYLGFYHDDCAVDHVLVAPQSEQPDPSTLAQFAFIDVDNGHMSDAPLPARLRIMNLFQILRSIPFSAFDENARFEFISEYLAVARPSLNLSLDECVQRVERIARRKVGRSVVHP